MIHVLCAAEFGDEQLQRLRRVSERVQIEQVSIRLLVSYLQEPDLADPDHARLDRLLREADILYTYRIPRDLDQIPRVRWIQLATAGADRLGDHPIWTRDGIRITTTSGIHATPIAEYVLGSMMAFARQTPRLWESQQRGEWAKWKWAQTHTRELRGATIGIVGYGSIGREVARLAHAFGMRVLAMKRDVAAMQDSGYGEPGVGDPDGTLPEGVYGYDQLHTMLPLCDYVVLTLPLTPATSGMFDAGALRIMRPNAYLVNIARGEIVVEADLARALKEGWIAGAGLDAFTEEPLPAESELWQLDNVILTPHISAATPVYNERACTLFAENLHRYLRDESLWNIVDPALGY
jgi:phosphoglycerate dehydrogenase-like enzyme